MGKFTYIDLFSGIGGFRIALDALGGQSIGYSEIDKAALYTYQMNWNDSHSHNLGDVTKINQLPQVDMIVGGVPCQSWSVAGKMRGFEDPRGKLWHDAIHMVKLGNPKVFIFENVKGLADPRNSENLNLIVDSLRALGYRVKQQLLNSYDFGLAQNRTRIFIVGFRNDQTNYSQNFEFPKSKDTRRVLLSYLDGISGRPPKKVKINSDVLFGGRVPGARNAFQKEDELNDFFVLCDTRNGHTTIHSWDFYGTTDREKNVCMTILKNRRKKRYGLADGNPLSYADLKELIPDINKKEIKMLIGKKIFKETSEGKIDLLNSKNSSGIDDIYRIYLPNSRIFSTLTATGTKDHIATTYVHGDDPVSYKQDFINQILKKKKFRQITAREAARIQGFPENFILHTNDRLAHRQFGNAVSPPVVRALAKSVMLTGIFGEVATIKIENEMRVFRPHGNQKPQLALQF
jgi:DNA (cytosine-5)-methyltransferase 1